VLEDAAVAPKSSVKDASASYSVPAGFAGLPAVHCPVTERVCASEGWWLFQSVLLGEQGDMADIATDPQLEARRFWQDLPGPDGDVVDAETTLGVDQSAQGRPHDGHLRRGDRAAGLAVDDTADHGARLGLQGRSGERDPQGQGGQQEPPPGPGYGFERGRAHKLTPCLEVEWLWKGRKV